VGFSLDLKVLAEVAPGRGAATAIRAAWCEDPAWRAAVRRLREAGETVVTVWPGDAAEAQAFVCDRELVEAGGRWVLQAIEAGEPPVPAAKKPASSSTASPDRPAPAAAIEHSR
jgi:ATP phosphoribosyltransferase regulatory subunit